MSNWDKLLPKYGLVCNGETRDKIQRAAEQLHIAWKYDGNKAYTFSHLELGDRYTLQPKQLCAIIAAARLLQLSDEYISDSALAEEAKCVLEAYYKVVSKQINENWVLGSLWLADSRKELLARYDIALEPEIRAALANAESVLDESLDYYKICDALKQKHTNVPEQQFAVLIAAARLGQLDKRYLLDGRFFHEAEVVLDMLVGHIRRCLQKNEAEQGGE